MRSFRLLMCLALAGGAAVGQSPLVALNGSIQELIHKVSPSIVQILVKSYVNVDTSNGDTDVVLGQQRVIGSGFVIDPAGYIVTNAHVLKGAQRIQVMLPTPASTATPLGSLSAPGKVVEANVVGVATDIDLAVIKVEGETLSALPLAHYAQLQQGELVFAFGSPEGLHNSVSMGVVSATARQTDPDSPLVYIQTDAPINPGNSGGPLVNANGEVVGVDTFIVSQSGGNEGLGFAIPSNIVKVSYQQLRQFGHIHRGQIGVGVETVTPTLAAALHLPQDSGLMLADVEPGSPAEAAGLRIQDIVLSVDGGQADNVPIFAYRLMTHPAGDKAHIVVLRGTQQLAFDVTVVNPPHAVDQLAPLADPGQDEVKQLGVLAMTLDPKLAAEIDGLRSNQGVVVMARSADSSADVALTSGDVIVGVNNQPVATLEELRSRLNAIPAGAAVALQVQREASLFYVAFTQQP